MKLLKIIIGVLVMSYLGYRIANGIVTNNYKIVMFIVAGIGAITVFYKPYFSFVLGYLLISRFFIDYYFHIPGFFKSFDVGFLLCAISGFLIWRRYLHARTDIFYGSFAVLILMFTTYLIFEVVQTSYIQLQDIKLTLQAGRFYFYLLFYFAAIPFILTYRKWSLLIKWLGGIAVFGAAVYDIQKIFNFGFLRPFYKTVGSNTVGGVEVLRMKAAIAGPGAITAGILLAYILAGQIKKRRKSWIYLAFLTLQPLLSFARGYIISVYALLVTVIIFAPVASLKKNKIIIYSFIGLLVVASGTSLVKWGDITVFPRLFFTRVASAGSDYMDKSGTYLVRQKMRDDRIKLVHDNPIFGVGFIHNDSGLYSHIEGGVGSGHDGYISLWGQIGYLGFALFITVTVMTSLAALRVSRLPIPYFYKAVAITYMGYIIWGFLNMFSTSAFILERSFVNMGLMMAFMQVGLVYHRMGLVTATDNVFDTMSA